MAPSKKLTQGMLPVLIVDDEEQITKAVARDLRRTAKVESCTDPVVAEELIKKNQYSVIISDLKMPRRSGLDVLKTARRVQPSCQRILLTAFLDLADLPDTINRARLNFIMTKPWEPEDLKQIVEDAQRANELERENLELRRLALVDGLTGVANNRYFWERLDSEFARAERYGRPLSLIMSDVDDFKKFNDEHGHLHGDKILQTAAQLLETEKRSTDTVARYGGEEFVIILPEISRKRAIEIANRHLSNVQAQAGINMSFGVATYPDDAKSSTELVDRADQALLSAKSKGKARVIGFPDI